MDTFVQPKITGYRQHPRHRAADDILTMDRSGDCIGRGCRWKEAETEGACLLKAREIAKEQAEDEGLWFAARTAAEAYLQQELRRLTAAIEGTDPP